MKQKFNYREKFSWSFLFLAAVGIAGIVYAFVGEPFNLRYRRLTLLEYPNSKYALIVVGILFIAYTIHKYLKVKAISQGEPIVVDGNSMQFSAISSYKPVSTTVHFDKVNELWNKEDKDDGESMIIYSENSKNRYEFFADNFESMSEFTNFKRILEAKCVNITNREAVQ
ncbi:hypothetical protein MKQ68_04670 [Chitinophaga horti]|uniref:PH domain-containing protein n=1 Tax=Chitinophaga horti TaxID=2920382 RepID=A0ABY6J7V1_9BACT|nr:hypothetical protein [Chitinophaga horti]UYQ94382.1 hypothetical protein MKQ68_04670 [Chitinophaga horti]